MPPARILLIDDEPALIQALTMLLAKVGYTVDTAENGAHALAQLHAHRYDVILCDLRMPALDGPGFYATLTQQDGALAQRVIFLTGDLLHADSTAFLEQCGQPWLTKPCTATTIRNAVQQMLHGKGGHEAER